MLSSEIVKRPIITEKSMQLVENENKYTFAVDARANKIQIKKAVQELFDVKVLNVNVINMPHKKRRVGQYEGFKAKVSKAIVELVKGDSIEIFSS
ncbi:MAG: 50S ribosomal protein L23 [Candidatus Izemoplasmataceae bacterium]